MKKLASSNQKQLKEYFAYSLEGEPSSSKKIEELLTFIKLKQSELKLKYPAVEFPQLRFFIGDVRDKDRVKRACEGVDVIILSLIHISEPTRR